MDSENSIRKNELLYQSSIGGLWTNNSDETFIVKAPKYWKWKDAHGNEVPSSNISEKNVTKLLKVTKIIMAPGAKDKHHPFHDGNVVVGRFPGWHRCKGWRKNEKKRCGKMIKLAQGDELPMCTVSDCSGRDVKDNKGFRKSTYAPIRFMLICSNGHIDDFPFHEWVHNTDTCNNHQLRYNDEGIASGLKGIKIECETCSTEVKTKYRTMERAMLAENFKKKEISCKGKSPWLNNEQCQCDADVTGVQKSSSNILFPIVNDYIFCPTYDSLPSWMKNFIDTDARGEQIKTIKGLAPTLPAKEWVKAITHGLESSKIEELIEHTDEIMEYIEPTKNTEDEFENSNQGMKQREYERFHNFPESQRLDDFTVVRPDISSYSEFISSTIKSITLLEKLRNTRIYVGFTRVRPISEEDGETSYKEIIKKCYGENQVLGDIIRGEGIYMEFHPSLLQEWAERTDVKSRFDILNTEAKESLNQNGGVKYMFLHSFSHALIHEMSIYSGYNTSSIRERIYLGDDGKNGKMCGILIYTASGDSEGSLGGLVRLGEPQHLEAIMRSAIEKAMWCSSDPLCSHAIPKGLDEKNLASCHHCLLLPETSCENQNQFLDRETIKSQKNSKLGVFKT